MQRRHRNSIRDWIKRNLSTVLLVLLLAFFAVGCFAGPERDVFRAGFAVTAPAMILTWYVERLQRT